MAKNLIKIRPYLKTFFDFENSLRFENLFNTKGEL